MKEVWPEWTINSIDSEIEKRAISYLEKEFIKETSIYSDMPLINRQGCLSSYLTFLCKSNFKSCDIDTNTSSPMCAAVCDDFVNYCGTNRVVCSKLPEEVKYF